MSLVDESDGVRKITPDDQSIYVDRIKELNSIFDNGKADSAKSQLGLSAVPNCPQPAGTERRVDAGFQTSRVA